jgi:CheY-like chemotaxis protein
VTHILVAEDNLAYREGIIALLEPLGYPCIAAVDGREAIEVVSDLSRGLSLLITDMEMPHRSGWDVIRAAREQRDGLPIIMQTGNAQYAYVHRRAIELDIVLIDKVDIPKRLLAATREALQA